MTSGQNNQTLIQHLFPISHTFYRLTWSLFASLPLRALVSVFVDDINEFGPEFEQATYSATLDLDSLEKVDPPVRGDEEEKSSFEKSSSISQAKGNQVNEQTEDQDEESEEKEEEDQLVDVMQVKAKDADCSSQFSSICRYELIPDELPLPEGLVEILSSGHIKLSKRRLFDELDRIRRDSTLAASLRFQVIAYDCGGKKSQTPAKVKLMLHRQCRPGLRDVDTQINYRPGSGDRSPFVRAHFDLCGAKCHRPNITVRLELEPAQTNQVEPIKQTGLPSKIKRPLVSRQPSIGRGSHPNRIGRVDHQQAFHCDRDSYSMVSKRRLCGSQSRTSELLPPYSELNKWLLPLYQSSINQLAKSKTSSSSSSSSWSSNPKKDEHGHNQQQSMFADWPRSKSLETSVNYEQLHDDHNDDDDDDYNNNDDNEEDDLGAYSLDGSYGRHAIQQLTEEPTPKESTHLNPAKESIHNSSSTTKASRHRIKRRRQRSAPLPTTESKLDPSSIYRDQVYRFDGSTSAVLIPKSVYQQADSSDFLFGSKHTLSFWMRHGPFRFNGNSSPTNNSTSDNQLDDLERHVKEHLLCASLVDEEGRFGEKGGEVARQHRQLHYALFVRNCKLVLLMRRRLQGKQANDSTSYKPAEWRWSLGSQSKACDQKWHLYTINVNQFDVELYVDGKQFVENYDNLLVLVDVPLKSSSSESGNVSMRKDVLAAGACWDPERKEMFGHFRGALAGMNVLVNENDEARTIECLGQCSEQLVSSSQSTMLRDQQNASQRKEKPIQNSLVSYQESQSRIILNGHDLLDVEEAMTQIAYTNSRLLPSIGKRLIQVDTYVECQQQLSNSITNNHQTTTLTSSSIPMNPSVLNSNTTLTNFNQRLKIEVNVLGSKNLPVISIVGMQNIAREYGPFLQGIRLFSMVNLRLKKLNLNSTNKAQPQQLLSLVQQQQKMQHHQVTAQPGYQQSTANKSSLEEADYIEDVQFTEINGPHPSLAPSSSKHLESQLNEQTTSELANTKRRIEACSVKIYPPLNNLHETLTLPIDQMNALRLYWRHSPEGFIIYGVDSVENYERLLQLILYKNQKPAYYTERTFKLTCSDMNGRLVSNEYSQTLTIIHNTSEVPDVTTKADPKSEIPHSKASESRVAYLKQSEMPHHHLQSSSQYTLLELEQPGSRNKMDRIATAILVFVFSLIVLMVVIALINLKDSWSNSSLSPQVTSSNKLYGHKQMPDGSIHALSFDIDKSPDYYYCNAQDCELLCEHRQPDCANYDDDDDDVDDDEEEEENGDYDDDLVNISNNQRAQKNSTSIIMNPIVHNKQQIDSLRPRTFVTEQRPNKNGAMTRKARTILTHHLPELAGTQTRAQMIPINELESSSSSSSSSEEEEGGESDLEDVEVNELPLCQHHRRKVESRQQMEQNEENEEYEIYHQHHHSCLKQGDSQLPSLCPHHSRQLETDFSEASSSSEDDSDIELAKSRPIQRRNVPLCYLREEEEGEDEASEESVTEIMEEEDEEEVKEYNREAGITLTQRRCRTSLERKV